MVDATGHVIAPLQVVLVVGDSLSTTTATCRPTPAAPAPASITGSTTPEKASSAALQASASSVAKQDITTRSVNDSTWLSTIRVTRALGNCDFVPSSWDAREHRGCLAMPPFYGPPRRVT